MKNKIFEINMILIILFIITSNFFPVSNALNILESSYSESNQKSIEIFNYNDGWPQTGDHGTIGKAITCDIDGNIFVCGNKNIDDENYDIFLIKYNSNGDVLKEYEFQTSQCEDVTEIHLDSNDNIIIFAAQAESISHIENGYSNLHIVQYDSNGIKLWNYSYKTSLHFRMGRGCIDSNDNIIVVGTIGNLQESSSIILIKLDQYGNKIWNTTYSNYISNYAYDVTVDSQDNIIIGSTCFSYEFYGYNIIKYDKDGLILWQSRIESRDAKAITVDKYDNIIITGSYFIRFNAIPKMIIYTVKFDSSGNILWDNSYNSCLHDLAFDIKADLYGNLIIVGISANDDLSVVENVIVVYDSNGTEISLRNFNINGWFNSITIDESNHVYITGFHNMCCYTNTFYEIQPPQIELLRPNTGNLYIFNKKILPLPEHLSMWSMCIGPIDITLEAENFNDFEKVEFYINERLKHVSESYPFKWKWISFGPQILTIKAYAKTGPIKHYQLYVLKFF